MRVEEFIRKAIRNNHNQTPEARRYRHVVVINGLNRTIVTDYDTTTIAMVDWTSRIALIDAEHYTQTTAKTITYVYQALSSSRLKIYEVPFLSDYYQESAGVHFVLHRSTVVNKNTIPYERIKLIIVKSFKEKTTNLYYNFTELTESAIKRGYFIFTAEKDDEIPEFPLKLLKTATTTKFQYKSKTPAPRSLTAFGELKDINDELYLLLDHLLQQNIVKFNKFSVIDNDTIVIRRTGGLLKKYNDVEVIKINWDALEAFDWRIIRPKIDFEEIYISPSY